MKRDVELHNLGQKHGADAGLVEQAVTELLPATSEQYLQGFRHAVQQQKNVANCDEHRRHAPSAGSGGSGDLPLPLQIIFGIALAIVFVGVAVMKWAAGRPYRLIAVILPILLFAVASTLPYKHGPGEIAAVFGLLSFCAVVGLAIGERKSRPLAGFALGFGFMFAGWLVAAILPKKNEALRVPVSTRDVLSARHLMLAALAFAPAVAIVVFFLVLFFGVSMPRAERPEVLGSLIQFAFIVGLLATLVGIVVFIWDVWRNERMPPSSRGLWTFLLLVWEPYVAPVYFWRFMR